MNKQNYGGGQRLPRRRAAPCSPTLSESDAGLIKGMLARGDAQHMIAAYFSVNSARIAEIGSGRRFANVPAAVPCDLPPPWLHPTPHDLLRLQEELAAARYALERAAQIIGNPLT